MKLDICFDEHLIVDLGRMDMLEVEIVGPAALVAAVPLPAHISLVIDVEIVILGSGTGAFVFDEVA